MRILSISTQGYHPNPFTDLHPLLPALLRSLCASYTSYTTPYPNPIYPGTRLIALRVTIVHNLLCIALALTLHAQPSVRHALRTSLSITTPTPQPHPHSASEMNVLLSSVRTAKKKCAFGVVCSLSSACCQNCQEKTRFRRCAIVFAARVSQHAQGVRMRQL